MECVRRDRWMPEKGAHGDEILRCSEDSASLRICVKVAKPFCGS